MKSQFRTFEDFFGSPDTWDISDSLTDSTYFRLVEELKRPGNNPIEIKTGYDMLDDTENTWEEDEETLEEWLESNLPSFTEEWKGKPFQPGDIVMASSGYSDYYEIKSPHLVVIVHTMLDEDGQPTYLGYLLSSQVQKANINRPDMPWNIYVEDGATIFSKPTNRHKDGFINLRDVYVLDNYSFEGGVYKGRANREFRDFLAKLIHDYYGGKDMSKVVWTQDPLNLGANAYKDEE